MEKNVDYSLIFCYNILRGYEREKIGNQSLSINESFTIGVDDLVYNEVFKEYRNSYRKDLEINIRINHKRSLSQPLKRYELKKFNKDLKVFKSIRNTDDYKYDSSFQDDIDQRIRQLEDRKERTKAYIRELYYKNLAIDPNIKNVWNAVKISEQLNREDICFLESKPFLTYQQAVECVENRDLGQMPEDLIYQRLKKFMPKIK